MNALIKIDTTTPAFAAGAWHAHAMLCEVKRCNSRAIRKTGDFDIAAVVRILARHSDGEPDHHAGYLTALAEFLAQALDGAVLDLSRWKPLDLPKPGAAP